MDLGFLVAAGAPPNGIIIKYKQKKRKEWGGREESRVINSSITMIPRQE